VGRPLVRCASGVAVRAIFVKGQGVRSSVGRWYGAHVDLLLVVSFFWSTSCDRRSVAGCRARGVDVLALVVGGQVVWYSIGRWCSAHAALLFVPLPFGSK